MSTRSSARQLLSPIEDPKRLLSRRNRSELSLLFNLEEDDMAGQAPSQGPIPDLRSMEELHQAPTDGVGDAIVVPPILANQFELKIGLLNLVIAIAFHGFENDDPHSHIRRFTKITQTVKLINVPGDVVKLLLFSFSLEGAARTWLEKEPPNSITTWKDLVSKFVNCFFPPSKTTNLRNEIMRFQQKFGETFAKAWDRFKDLLNKCPYHGFYPLHQIDTFYNSLNKSEQDSLNSAANGNFLTKNTQEALTIIEKKSKVQTSRNKPQVASASESSAQDAHITALTKQVKALLSLHRPRRLIHICLQKPPDTNQCAEKTVSRLLKVVRNNYIEKAIERLKQGESINVQDLETNLYWEFGKFTSQDGESLESYYSRFVTLVKQSQELKTVSYHKLYDILKQHQNEVNEIRAERLAHRNSLPETEKIQLLPLPCSLLMIQNPATITEDDKMSRKEIDKLHGLYFPLIRTGYDNQRALMLLGPRENVVLLYAKVWESVLQLQGIWACIQGKQADWKDDTDDESDDQELEAHYMYMAQIHEVTPDSVDNSGPIFDDEPMHKVQNNNDNYNVFAMENEHPEQPESSNDIYWRNKETPISHDSSDNFFDRSQDDQDETEDLDKNVFACFFNSET
ncbi:reverse transcriptase domain-containing protein [Tanacetum coccineum]